MAFAELQDYEVYAAFSKPPLSARGRKRRKQYQYPGVEDDREKYYFTFGHGQPNEGCFVVIDGYDECDARLIMISNFGRRWCGCYTERGWLGEDGISQQEKFGLKEIPLPPPLSSISVKKGSNGAAAH